MIVNAHSIDKCEGHWAVWVVLSNRCCFFVKVLLGNLIIRFVCYFDADGFSALTLSLGCQEEHPARKNLCDEVLVWLSVWSKVQIVCIWSS